MVKVDVDIEKGILAIGGEWHTEGDELLNTEEASRSQDIWGVNFYPWKKPDERIEYVALINIKPAVDHRQMEIQDIKIKNRVREIIERLLLSHNENLQ